MSNHHSHYQNHSPWSINRSRLEHTGPFESTHFSQNFPVRPRDEHPQYPAKTHATLVPQPGRDGFGFEDLLGPANNTRNPAYNTQSSLQKDPTLAPEPSLHEFDLPDMLQAPHSDHDEPYLPQGMDSSVQTMATNYQQIPDAFADVKTPGIDVHSGISASYPAGAEHTADAVPDWMKQFDGNLDGINFGDIDLGMPAPYEAAYWSEPAVVPPLPELPTSPGTQFECLAGIEAFAMVPISSNVQHGADWSSSVPGYATQYPDPEEFKTPFSSTPGLTSAFTTPSRQQGVLRDTSTDARLVQLRREGKSYKQIRDILGLDEAESTLRGRFRTLTKPKEARVRKPAWTGPAIRFLINGVKHFSNSNPIAVGHWSGLDGNAIHQFANKVPWKQVAEWMQDKGTYRYGNATVKKKYLAVLKRQGAPI